jgi:Big-like domain-containing protein
MTKKLSAWLGLLAAVSFLASLSACGHEQQLVSITVIPAIENFGSAKTPVELNAGLNVQLRALGSYIHPPVTKDITNQVTWVSNTPQMVTVDANGLITATGQSCGGTIITATVTTNHSDGNISSNGALVTGSMQANVICFTGP